MRLGVGNDNLIFLIVASARIGFILPNEVLGCLIKRRKKRITRALPNALDLLIVCVESGLGLDQAIIQVSREMPHGKRRPEALKNLGERSGVDDMKKLCSTLVQADRFGTSIPQTPHTHADFMPVTARQRAEEKAAKLAIKLVFPIFFCILPSLFVVTAGPVVFRIINVLIPMMKSG